MKQNIRKKLIIIILVLLFSMNITLGINANEVSIQENSNIQDKFSDISARNIVLANSDTGKIVYERNKDEKKKHSSQRVGSNLSANHHDVACQSVCMQR